MDAQWIAKRAQLRQLLKEQPQWTNVMYAETVGMSVAWVKEWKRIFRQGDPNDSRMLLSRPRHRRTPFEVYEEAVIEAVLDIRDNPPEYCKRVPGPALIQYELKQRFGGSAKRYPHSTSTIWAILERHQRIRRCRKRAHWPVERPEPMKSWEIDFADIPSIPAEPDGKQQHAVEMFNIVDRGTSILIASAASDNYTAETSILALMEVLLEQGLPDVITLDRDPRFVGGFQKDSFPSAWRRFVLCLDIKLAICSPRRPDEKPFVERVHRAIKEEALVPESPTTRAAAQELLKRYRALYNTLRPHQGSACRHQPPFVAFPQRPQLRHFPDFIDPDHWLQSLHGQIFKRRVQANGSVKVDRRSYSVGQAFKGQPVLLEVDAKAQIFRVIHPERLVKSLPIKGLHGQVLDFDVYLELICREARTEWRQTKRLVRQRRLAWAA